MYQRSRIQSMTNQELILYEPTFISQLHIHLLSEEKTIPFSPLHNPRRAALSTQYSFLPRDTPLLFLIVEYSSLISLGMKEHCLHKRYESMIIRRTNQRITHMTNIVALTQCDLAGSECWKCKSSRGIEDKQPTSRLAHSEEHSCRTCSGSRWYLRTERCGQCVLQWIDCCSTTPCWYQRRSLPRCHDG